MATCEAAERLDVLAAAINEIGLLVKKIDPDKDDVLAVVGQVEAIFDRTRQPNVYPLLPGYEGEPSRTVRVKIDEVRWASALVAVPKGFDEDRTDTYLAELLDAGVIPDLIDDARWNERYEVEERDWSWEEAECEGCGNVLSGPSPTCAHCGRMVGRAW